MLEIQDLREKEVKFAWYFKKAKKQPLTRTNLFNWWSMTSYQDFKYKKKALFTVYKDQLDFKAKLNSKQRDAAVLESYRDMYERAYANISRMYNEYDDTQFLSAMKSVEADNLKKLNKYIKEQQLDVHIVRMGNDEVTKSTMYKLRKYKLMYYEWELKEGTFDQVLAYMQTEKKIPKVKAA